MKAIPLHPIKYGRFAIVDDSDFETLSKFKWRFHASGGYAVTHHRENGKQKSVLMHRQILRAPPHLHTDHINHNGLDNRRANIRLCSRSENMQNRKRHKNNRAGIKGVRMVRGGKWEARVQSKGMALYIGHFITAKEASEAYNRAAKKLHGNFSNPNP